MSLESVNIKRLTSDKIVLFMKEDMKDIFHNV